MNRIERVKSVYDLIKDLGDYERNFDTLYAKLLEEFDIEFADNPNYRTNHYLNDLRQTKDKQARIYMAANEKRPKKGAPSEFGEFIRHFRNDTKWADTAINNKSDQSVPDE
jgi:hypothetical protein